MASKYRPLNGQVTAFGHNERRLCSASAEVTEANRDPSILLIITLSGLVAGP